MTWTNCKAMAHLKKEHGYALLEKCFVSNYLHDEQVSTDRLFQVVQARIQHIIGEWEKALANRAYMSRSARNRVIMDAYRLFEWPKGNDGNPRFLRAMEFNQMSVCHYSLAQKKRRCWPMAGARFNEKVNWTICLKICFSYMYENRRSLIK